MAKTLAAQPAPEPEATPTPPRRGGGKSAEKKPAGIAASRKIRPAHDDLRKWPFSLVFSGNWELAEVGGVPHLLPDFEVVRDMPGSNNVRQRQGKRPPDLKLRDGWLSEEGRTIIPRAEYLVSVEVEDEDGETVQLYYYETFEDPVEYPDGRVRVVCDIAARNVWRLSLVKRGLIPPPTDLVLVSHRMRRESDIQRASGHPKDSGYAWNQKTDRLNRELSQLDDAWARTVAVAPVEA